MVKTLKIKIINGTQEIKTVPLNTKINNLIPDDIKNKDEIVGAKVNNEITSLSYKLKVNASLQFITKANPFGMEIYRRSLAFVLAKVFSELFSKNTLKIRNSLGPGYYFDTESKLTKDEIAKLEVNMHKLIESNKTIHREKISYNDAIEYATNKKRDDILLLLNSMNMSKLSVYRCDNFFQVFDGPLVLSTGMLKLFKIIPYHDGFILQFPRKSAPHVVAEFKPQEKIFEVHEEYTKWGKVLQVDNVGALNKIITSGDIDNFIQIVESLFAMKLANIAKQIYDKKNEVRLITIAGPSSAGKTTSTKKLSINLRALGLKPFMISVDDYFVDRDKTPLTADGKPDFENINALNIELFNKHLMQLLNRESIHLCKYDFITGKSGFRKELSCLQDDQIILIEGIHCLNDKLTEKIPAKNKFKIYISALSQMNIDDNNRIPTTDVRIIRRIVRDYKFRGHSAKRTLQMWSLVRKGEEKYIFPFQNNADAYFNSALDYELAVLRPYAEPILMQIKPNDEEYGEALRLLRFLRYFLFIPERNIPNSSILREFIGGSIFNY